MTNTTFDPRPTFLNLVEVWGVGGQVQYLASCLLNQRLNASPFVEGGIIDDQPLSWSEAGNQAGFNPGFKDVSISLRLQS